MKLYKLFLITLPVLLVAPPAFADTPVNLQQYNECHPKNGQEDARTALPKLYQKNIDIYRTNLNTKVYQRLSDARVMSENLLKRETTYAQTVRKQEEANSKAKQTQYKDSALVIEATAAYQDQFEPAITNFQGTVSNLQSDFVAKLNAVATQGSVKSAIDSWYSAYQAEAAKAAVTLGYNCQYIGIGGTQTRNLQGAKIYVATTKQIDQQFNQQANDILSSTLNPYLSDLRTSFTQDVNNEHQKIQQLISSQRTQFSQDVTEALKIDTQAERNFCLRDLKAILDRANTEADRRDQLLINWANGIITQINGNIRNLNSQHTGTVSRTVDQLYAADARSRTKYAGNQLVLARINQYEAASIGDINSYNQRYSTVYNQWVAAMQGVVGDINGVHNDLNGLYRGKIAQLADQARSGCATNSQGHRNNYQAGQDYVNGVKDLNVQYRETLTTRIAASDIGRRVSEALSNLRTQDSQLRADLTTNLREENNLARADIAALLNKK